MKSQKIKIRFLLIFLTFAFYILSLAPKARADFSLAVNPPILQIKATAPAGIRSDITIKNTSADPVELSIVLRPFHQSSENNGTAEFLDANEVMPGNDPRILGKIQILDNENPTQDIILAPLQEKKLTLLIVLPKDEPAGDYYFTVLFLAKDTASEHKNVQSLGGIGTNVLLSIGPEKPTTGNLQKFSAPWFSFSGPVQFILLVENTSPHFIEPQGNIVITNTFGQTMGVLKLLPVNILANTSRYLPSEQPSTGNQPVVIWNEKALFGLYSARLRLKLSDNGPLIDRTIHFAVIPIEAIMGIVLASLLVAIVTVRVRRRIKT